MSEELKKTLDGLTASRGELKRKMEDMADNFRMESVQPVVEAFCRKHKLNFSSGMGGYTFWSAGETKIERDMFDSVDGREDLGTDRGRALAVEDLRAWHKATKKEALKAINIAVELQALREYLDNEDLIYQKCGEGAFLQDYQVPEE